MSKRKKQYSEKTYIVCGHIMHILAVITFVILAIPLYTMGIIGGIVFTIISILIWITGSKFLKIGKRSGNKQQGFSVKSEANTVPKNTMETTIPVKSETPKEEKTVHTPKDQTPEPVFTPSDVSEKRKYIEHTYKVSGTSFRKENILSLSTENPYYDYTKRELIDEDMTDERIYQYDFFTARTELVPEPNNQHDPDAVKVIVDGVHIGYIKTGETKHVLNAINSKHIKRIYCQIYGGKYKYLTLSDDYMYDKEPKSSDYELEKHETEFGAKLTIEEWL